MSPEACIGIIGEAQLNVKADCQRDKDAVVAERDKWSGVGPGRRLQLLPWRSQLSPEDNL